MPHPNPGSPPAAPSAARDARVIGTVGVAHGTSHFFHLILAPLFPWIRDAFALTYAELGLLMTVFFVVSGIGQALGGFIVDRFGALRVLATGLLLLGIAALGLAASGSYPVLLLFSGLAGAGNSIFHPADYTILNRHVSPPRLAHAFSVHGLSGTLGWAAAPPFLAGIAGFQGWRMALVAASPLAFVALALVLAHRGELETRLAAASRGGPAGSPVAFLRLPAIWMCFLFFLFSAVALGGIQSFAVPALIQGYGVALGAATACITAYMLANAAGTIAGGFLATRTLRHERVIASGFAMAAALSLAIAARVPAAMALLPMLAVIGFFAGLAGPSRDLLVRAAAPRNATGRVYGIVYSGLDVGLAMAPPVYGAFMDAHQPLWLFAGIAAAQAAALLTAVGAGANVTQTVPRPA